MDIRKVKKLIELLESSGMAEIEITEGEESVRISRQGSAPVYQPPAAYAPPPAPAPASPQASPSEEAPPGGSAQPPAGKAVTAPMVGTFYRSSSPGSSPFVDVGQTVQEGDVLCIIEAMKMMNEISAEKAGTIKAIEVENGEPVEYGQTLFVLE